MKVIPFAIEVLYLFIEIGKRIDIVAVGILLAGVIKKMKLEGNFL